MSKSNDSRAPALGRRQIFKVGAAAAGAGLLATTLSDVAAKGGGGDDDEVVVVLPPSPYTQPFIEALPVYLPKESVAALDPAPQKTSAPGECGRADHQRWEDFAPDTKKFYEMHVRQELHSFHRQLPDQYIWGYDGILPGPTFVARYGEPIIVRIYNDLPGDSKGFGSPEISTHLHNLHDGSASDGFTGDYYSKTKSGPTMTGPGAYKDHHYVNCYAGYDAYHQTGGDPREALGTLWYHDHRLDFTAPNVYKGLAGFYLLFDEIDSGNENDAVPGSPTYNAKALGLPSGVGKYDIPLVFQDKRFDANGFQSFNQFEADGLLGDKFCVNGKIQPYFKVERRKYRFRLLDGGPSRFYEFYLTYNGADQAFDYIANDGNLLEKPLTMTRVRLGVAERADIVIDFGKYPKGAQLFIVNKLEQLDGRGPRDKILKPGTQILRFDVGDYPAATDISRVPATLRELPPVNLAEVVTTRTFLFDRSNGGWTVNGKLFDVRKATAQPKRNTAEIWVLKSTGNWSHPVHIHFEEGRILSRNGAAPAPHERGRKDVYVLGPNDEVRVFLRFRDFEGKYMMHCHNTIHEDHAMMIRFDIVPP
jgi:FtsP/CotA-like multicopper oxidase with cupredoxin domain